MSDISTFLPFSKFMEDFKKDALTTGQLVYQFAFLALALEHAEKHPDFDWTPIMASVKESMKKHRELENPPLTDTPTHGL